MINSAARSRTCTWKSRKRLGWDTCNRNGRTIPRGLTPPRLAQILQQAETGDITAQHEMFADMEEKDAHLFSVMQTRRLTVSQLDWSIEPPANPTSAEQDEAAFVTEVLQGLEMEDVF